MQIIHSPLYHTFFIAGITPVMGFLLGGFITFIICWSLCIAPYDGDKNDNTECKKEGRSDGCGPIEM